jgi:hypothetical protein
MRNQCLARLLRVGDQRRIDLNAVAVVQGRVELRDLAEHPHLVDRQVDLRKLLLNTGALDGFGDGQARSPLHRPAGPALLAA